MPLRQTGHEIPREPDTSAQNETTFLERHAGKLVGAVLLATAAVLYAVGPEDCTPPEVPMHQPSVDLRSVLETQAQLAAEPLPQSC